MTHQQAKTNTGPSPYPPLRGRSSYLTPVIVQRTQIPILEWPSTWGLTEKHDHLSVAWSGPQCRLWLCSSVDLFPGQLDSQGGIWHWEIILMYICLSILCPSTGSWHIMHLFLPIILFPYTLYSCLLCFSSLTYYSQIMLNFFCTQTKSLVSHCTEARQKQKYNFLEMIAAHG